MDQGKITDYFASSKKGGRGESLKRKVPITSPTRQEFEQSAKKTKTVGPILQSRGKLLLALSQSPVKSPLKSPYETPRTPTKHVVRSLSEALNSPIKIKEPAHLRFRHLAEKEAENSLTLPSKFRSLVDMFKCVDTVLAMLTNRKEPCTFERVKKGVQEMSRKLFDISKLALLKTVYPDAYELTYDKQTKMSKDLTSKLELILIIKPACGDNMSPSVILQRKRVFATKLLKIVQEHHQEFLQSLDPPISVANKDLVRWHPNFKLENIPDIEPIPDALPPPPLKADLTSAQNYLSSVRSRLGVESPSKPKDVPDELLTSPVKIAKGALKGLSTALLDKIKAREAQKLSLEMTRPPEVEKKISMIKRLPDFIRILNNYFVGERKATLPLESVVHKCKDSYYTCISAPEVHDFVKLLGELLPDWLYILEVKKGTFVKIDKNKSIEDLIKRLDRKADQLKQGKSF